MKKILLLLMSLVLLVGLCPAGALADDTGVLSQPELNEWIRQVLLKSAGQTPLNAPVGEEALTEDGYAFIYDFATLYYNKPVLDAQSVLMGVTVTDEQFASPRGVHLGSAEEAILYTYGWQNPYLLGDGVFASFYLMDQLPEAAYWSWAQHDEDWKLTAVQCAIHVRLGDDAYSDAGLSYTLEDGVVTGIRVYGLSSVITHEEVRSNLDAVRSVDAAIGSDEWVAEEGAGGYTVANDAAPFGEADLRFGGMDYLSLSPQQAQALLGSPVRHTEVQDDNGDLLMNCEWDGLTFSFTQSADGARVTADTIVAVSDAYEGPRGVRVGMTQEEVLALFCSDGEGRTLAQSALLYGDGITAPYGLLARTGQEASISFAAQAQGNTITLYMAFADGVMHEWMIYSW